MSMGGLTQPNQEPRTCANTTGKIQIIFTQTTHTHTHTHTHTYWVDHVQLAVIKECARVLWHRPVCSVPQRFNFNLVTVQLLCFIFDPCSFCHRLFLTQASNNSADNAVFIRVVATTTRVQASTSIALIQSPFNLRIQMHTHKNRICGCQVLQPGNSPYTDWCSTTVVMRIFALKPVDTSTKISS